MWVCAIVRAIARFAADLARDVPARDVVLRQDEPMRQHTTLQIGGPADLLVEARTGDAVAASLAFEVRPSLVYDAEGKLWIAWEESGDHWGKDFGALKKQGIPLYQTGRALAVRVLTADGKWLAPPDVMDAMPSNTRRPNARGGGRAPAGARGFIAPCFPRLATGADGNVWLAFRGRPG